MTDLSILLAASAVVALVNYSINLRCGSPTLKFVTFLGMWIGVGMGFVALWAITVEAL